MNNKALIGIVIAALILVGAFFISKQASAPAPEPAPEATTTPSTAGTPTTTPTTGSGPRVEQLPPVVVKPGVGAFDQTTFTTSSPRPAITGTASNVKTVQLVVINDKGVGIVGGMTIPVVNGTWKFQSSLNLAPGTYRLELGGVEEIQTATLVVTK